MPAIRSRSSSLAFKSPICRWMCDCRQWRRARPARPSAWKSCAGRRRGKPSTRRWPPSASPKRATSTGRPRNWKRPSGFRPITRPPTPNLGVEYLRLRRFEEARAEIERALAIAGPNTRDLGNLAFALAALQRLPEAAESARKALALDRGNMGAHYLLGAILTLSPATRAEGVAHLKTAAATLECARKALDGLEK